MREQPICPHCRWGRVHHIGIVVPWQFGHPNQRRYGCNRCDVIWIEPESGPHAVLIPSRTAEDIYAELDVAVPVAAPVAAPAKRVARS